MKLSPELREVLSMYLTWAENGAPHKRDAIRDLTLSTGTGVYQFRLCSGLCWNATRSEAPCAPLDRIVSLDAEFKALLAGSGLDPYYPFGLDAYDADTFNLTHHKNPARLQWIRDTLENAE